MQSVLALHNIALTCALEYVFCPRARTVQYNSGLRACSVHDTTVAGHLCKVQGLPNALQACIHATDNANKPPVP
jgi:hypothetical protein